jgi:hypothetical protein
LPPDLLRNSLRTVPATTARTGDLVMSLVEMALARPAGERESYLENACDHDSKLFEEVWKYVEWEERMKGFLLDPLVLPASERGFEPATKPTALEESMRKAQVNADEVAYGFGNRESIARKPLVGVAGFG